MPTRARRPCSEQGCAALVDAGRFCAAHQPAVKRIDDRATAHERGYGAAWRRLRVMYLRRNPVCVDPFGVHHNAIVVATDVDHIIPKRAAGRDAFDNFQALCHACHSRKTQSGL